MIAIEISSVGATRVVPWGDGDTTLIRLARGTKRDISASFLRFAWFTMAPATEAMWLTVMEKRRFNRSGKSSAKIARLFLLRCVPSPARSRKVQRR